MRDKLIKIWRVMTKTKWLRPLVIFIRHFGATSFFNAVLDFMEVYIFHTSYEDSAHFFAENSDRTARVMESFADDRSRTVYANLLNYRGTHYRKYLRSIVSCNQYFDKEFIHFKEQESFVDCGAYRGDTIRQFCAHLPVKDDFRVIFAFEPDSYNYSKLMNYVKKLPYKDKIRCFPSGTWSESGTLHFTSNIEEACTVATEGETIIPVTTLDETVGDEQVTFIKMDVEGAELPTLKGAKKLIDRLHPNMAICIYHSDADMVDIAEYLKQVHPFYDLYVRHYSHFYADTILYAIDPARKDKEH